MRTDVRLGVRAYGAVGNGQADDTTAIQAAIDDVAASGGGRVLVPPGAYRISAPVHVPLSVVLDGDGPGASSFVRSGPVDPMVWVRGASGAYLHSAVRGLLLDGGGFAGRGLLVQTTAQGAGEFLYGVDLADLVVQNMIGSDGVELVGLSEFSLERCLLQNSARQLHVHGAAGSTLGAIRRCAFLGGGARQVQIGESGENCDTLVMENCAFGGSLTGPDAVALYVASCDNSDFETCYFEHTGALADAIRLVGRNNTVGHAKFAGSAAAASGLNILYGSDNTVSMLHCPNPNVSKPLVIAGGVDNTVVFGGRGPSGALAPADVQDGGTATKLALRGLW